MKELNEEQKKLADQMVDDIQEEIKTNLKAEETGIEAEVVPAKPNALVDGILEWGKTIDIDATPPNSVLLVKINLEDPDYAHSFQIGVIKHVLEPRFSKLREKKITVLFMGAKDDLSVLTERDMEKSGWKKVEQSRIITL